MSIHYDHEKGYIEYRTEEDEVIIHQRAGLSEEEWNEIIRYVKLAAKGEIIAEG